MSSIETMIEPGPTDPPRFATRKPRYPEEAFPRCFLETNIEMILERAFAPAAGCQLGGCARGGESIGKRRSHHPQILEKTKL